MNLLFICTHNRCRSILSEAITNHFSDGNVTAFSAGSQPSGKVHPLSLKYLQQKGISIDGLKSQSWDDFKHNQPDIVITVCDSAAKETCPIWFGNTIQVHWGLPDPSKVVGSDKEIEAAFLSVIKTITSRVEALLSINFDTKTQDNIKNSLQTISNLE